MRNVRTMFMANIFVGILMRVSVCRDVMRYIFVNWSNMLTGFVPWTIAGRWKHGIVLRKSLVISRSMRFVCLTARRFL
jgi:hypothetical protein